MFIGQQTKRRQPGIKDTNKRPIKTIGIDEKKRRPVRAGHRLTVLASSELHRRLINRLRHFQHRQERIARDHLDRDRIGV